MCILCVCASHVCTQTLTHFWSELDLKDHNHAESPVSQALPTLSLRLPKVIPPIAPSMRPASCRAINTTLQAAYLTHYVAIHKIKGQTKQCEGSWWKKVRRTIVIMRTLARKSKWLKEGQKTYAVFCRHSRLDWQNSPRASSNMSGQACYLWLCAWKPASVGGPFLSIVYNSYTPLLWKHLESLSILSHLQRVYFRSFWYRSFCLFNRFQHWL